MHNSNQITDEDGMGNRLVPRLGFETGMGRQEKYQYENGMGVVLSPKPALFPSLNPIHGFLIFFSLSLSLLFL